MNHEPEPSRNFGRSTPVDGELANDHLEPLDTTANTLPDLDASSCDLWLELLADDELTSVQRNDLLGYLEQHPQHWRACALAFWDRQCLTRAWGSAAAEQSLTDVKLPCATSDTELPQRDGRRSTGGWQTRLAWVVTAALALLTVATITLGVHQWRAANQSELVRLELTERLAESLAQAEDLQQELVAERTVLRTLRSVFPDQPCLIEIESTEDRVVYLTDGRVSEDLVRGLLSLGQVEVRPFRPLVETSLWQSMVRPVVAIEVAKNSTQVFPGEL